MGRGRNAAGRQQGIGTSGGQGGEAPPGPADSAATIDGRISAALDAFSFATYRARFAVGNGRGGVVASDISRVWLRDGTSAYAQGIAGFPADYVVHTTCNKSGITNAGMGLAHPCDGYCGHAALAIAHLEANVPIQGTEGPEHHAFRQAYRLARESRTPDDIAAFIAAWRHYSIAAGHPAEEPLTRRLFVSAGVSQTFLNLIQGLDQPPCPVCDRPLLAADFEAGRCPVCKTTAQRRCPQCDQPISVTDYAAKQCPHCHHDWNPAPSNSGSPENSSDEGLRVWALLGRTTKETPARGRQAKKSEVKDPEPLDVERVLALEDRLRARVFGQDEAIQQLLETIRAHAAGLQDPQRPMLVALMLGPTGVGKTELARTLATALFSENPDANAPDSDSFLQIDMSEYSERHQVARLFGSPPGYVGYEQGGQLTEAIRLQPRRVVLLDEIEKAHPQVWDSLLGLFDRGRMTDGHGQTVDGRHAIYLMTSNLGSELYQRQRPPIGFRPANAQETVPQLRDAVVENVKKTFRPEWVNRLDQTIVFNALPPEIMGQITNNQLQQLASMVRAREITVRWEPDVVQFLVTASTEGEEANMGARPIARQIKRNLWPPLTNFILAKQSPNAVLRLRDGKIVVEADN